MPVKSQLGQGILLAVLAIGTIMATFVIFGAKRQEDVAKLLHKFDMSQAAFEALASAAKRVQYMYAAESGCDPGALDRRLSAMAALPDLVASPNALGVQVGSNANYTPAQVATGITGAARQNRCTGGTGCRQFAVPVDNEFFIVTVGQVLREDATATGRTTDCPRDIAVRLSTAVGGNVYFQRFSLTNLCSLAECTCVTGACTTVQAGFTALNTPITNSNVTQTTACTAPYGYMRARRYGSITNSSNLVVGVNDLRWARRYLETGGGSAGETNFMQVTFDGGSPTLLGNGACPAANSATQCKIGSCVPAFDLNRDGINNEADLAILEHYLRGYINSIPVNELN